MLLSLHRAACGFIACIAFCGWANAAMIDGNRIMDQDMGENLCALTFDDGPSPATTPILLDMLAQYKVPATFFVLGKNARAFPSIVRRIVAEGHELGNHSWSHPNLKYLSSDGQAHEIEATDALLRSLGGAPLYVRPPYGAYDERTMAVAEKLGLSLILWSMDSFDWKRLPADYARILSTRGTVYEPGTLRGIFLFHDIHLKTVNDFHRIMANLRAGGCEKFVTVSEYLRGILDPEPPMLMSRRPAKTPGARDPGYAIKTGPAPLARCSVPWKPEKLNLEDAQAAVTGSSSVQ